MFLPVEHQTRRNVLLSTRSLPPFSLGVSCLPSDYAQLTSLTPWSNEPPLRMSTSRSQILTKLYFRLSYPPGVRAAPALPLPPCVIAAWFRLWGRAGRHGTRSHLSCWRRKTRSSPTARNAGPATAFFVHPQAAAVTAAIITRAPSSVRTGSPRFHGGASQNLGFCHSALRDRIHHHSSSIISLSSATRRATSPRFATFLHWTFAPLHPSARYGGTGGRRIDVVSRTRPAKSRSLPQSFAAELTRW